ncbi:hypothetical protein CPAST_c34070 [Clostridium pasteurianum DSM 525 = ATCC 6013]|uniref:Uncharacterized protein n=1 Tax=Clostridium pasteurianum DSM 525 = ATCC 6013 TaxID=1262449 RepID=A0A0H3JAE3_CLOPA|nr:hypothetical protein CPAST_c34070 [Clostridium pasteurianum DSM 525 = ATCC 6013]AJA53461.1 hypothetical protein CLPA_c34070 [Clostridium pasteurianum DSM 525 = ATCC 6013]KRU14514.1 hypothetical protein CP6013_03773 [Clostridium pasteurianum DSM 525 = ATCC 6013]
MIKRKHKLEEHIHIYNKKAATAALFRFAQLLLGEAL